MSVPTLELTKEGNFSCPDDPGEPYSMAKRRSVTLDEAKILSELSRDKVVLEIGTGLGVSTREMAIYAKVVYSVDIDPWTHKFKFPNNVVLCTEVPRGIKFDLAFIDGSHLYHHIMDDIAKVDADLIVIHDYYLPNVARAVKNSGLKEVKVYGTRCDMRSFTK